MNNTTNRIVSQGFEPCQRESKSLVLPLHHETDEGVMTELNCPRRNHNPGSYH